MQGETYQQQMHQWMQENEAKRGLFKRILLPDPKLPFSKKLAGILLRLAVLILLPLLIFRIVFSRSVESEAFADAIANQIREAMACEQVISTPITWTGSGFKCEELRLVGGPDSPYATLDLTGAFFTLSARETLKQPWPVHTIAARTGNLVLKGGPNVDAGSDSKERPKGATASGFIKPGLLNAPIRSVSIDKFNVLWQQGSGLRDTRLRITRDGRKGWNFKLREGTLNHHTLSGVSLNDDLNGNWDGQTLKVEEGNFFLGETGKAKLRLSINTDASLTTKAHLELTTVDLRHLIPEGYTGFVGGQVNGHLDLEGALTSQNGLGWSGSLSPYRVNLGSMGLLTTLSEVTENRGLRFMPLNQGKVNFSHRRGEALQIQIDSGANNLAKLNGNLQLQGNEFTGQVDLGIEDYVFRHAKKLQESHFTRQEEGISYQNVPISGRIDRWTKALDSELTRLYLSEKEEEE